MVDKANLINGNSSLFTDKAENRLNKVLLIYQIMLTGIT